ncbi:DUF456 domain-containing protein [Kallotenue papyrolyticum]|uniref:DUF456 domain-containing protein n=1 Tax=Kallotenue papyrolyticum TaxID=1325125 RepID=UPI0004923355|nr:DUF456 domain-containing protein [Kallotenue papyrolyticum]
MDGPLAIALLIMIVGTIGALVPALPGPALVWLGALYYAWQTGWTVVGWPSLLLLLALAVLGGTTDLWMSYFGARTGGASLGGTLASLVGGVIGLLIFSLPGAILGALLALALVEFSRHRDWRRVLRAGGGWLIGSLLSALVEVLICLVMIGLFLLAVWV